MMNVSRCNANGAVASRPTSGMNTNFVPMRTFSPCPPFGGSKGHFEEAGIRRINQNDPNFNKDKLQVQVDFRDNAGDFLTPHLPFFLKG